MKKYIIFFLCVYTSLLNAQCPTDSNFIISSQSELDNFSAMYPDCTSVEFITISGADITDLSGLSQIESVGILTIEDNPILETLDGLGPIDFAGSEVGVLSIISNDMLTSIVGLSQSTNMTSPLYLEVKDNPLLTSLTPLSSFQGEVSFEIHNCDSLMNLSGLEEVTSTGGMVITSNENLTNLSALSSINGSVSQDLIIASNPSLTSLEGLEGITAVIGVVNNIADNDLLTSLDGFQPTTTFQLNIFGNDLLTDITSLESLEDIIELQMYQNAILSACSISSLCAFLETEAGSFSTVENNAEGCNSIEEILDNCELGLADTTISESIRIYLNPVNDLLQIDTSTDIIIEKIRLFSINGNQIGHANYIDFMDVSTIAKGVYFLKIDSDKGIITKKFLKK